MGHNPDMATAAASLHVAPSLDDGLALRYFPVTSQDGTELTAWTNDVAGPTVLAAGRRERDETQEFIDTLIARRARRAGAAPPALPAAARLG